MQIQRRLPWRYGNSLTTSHPPSHALPSTLGIYLQYYRTCVPPEHLPWLPGLQGTLVCRSTGDATLP